MITSVCTSDGSPHRLPPEDTRDKKPLPAVCSSYLFRTGSYPTGHKLRNVLEILDPKNPLSSIIDRSILQNTRFSVFSRPATTLWAKHVRKTQTPTFWVGDVMVEMPGSSPGSEKETTTVSTSLSNQISPLSLPVSKIKLKERSICLRTTLQSDQL